MADVRIIRMDTQRANDAWEAHKALLLHEAEHPELSANPVWQCLRMDAYETFCAAFEAEG